MSKKISNKLIKTAGLLTGAFALSLGILAINYKDSKKDNNDVTFIKHDEYYNSNQTPIITPNSPSSTSTDISMSSVVESGNYSSNVITISNEEDLIKFSTLCNGSQGNKFSGYSYRLISNIDCTNEFTPVGYPYEFTGTFNGDGYEIKNLVMRKTSFDSSYTATYYSMFTVIGSTGTVTNLGLTRPELSLQGAPDTFGQDGGGVSYFVGLNKGTVSHSFVVDDGAALEEKAGITAADCRIASFCVTNKGSLDDNYIIISTVANVKNENYEGFSEIAFETSGSDSLADNYYFNGAILNYDSSTFTYKNRTSYNIIGEGSGLGTWCLTKDVVLSKLTKTNGWYKKSDYEGFESFVGFDYAVRRGISFDSSTNTFTISSAKDFVYMYELFNSDDKLAGNGITYQITNDIDLANVPAYLYSYNKGIGATITGTSLGSGGGTPKMINNLKSNYPTIYNADVMSSERLAKNAGVDCYGLFNVVTAGTIKDLNIVPKAMNLDDIDNTSTNAKGIGAVSGYVEKGIIDNVHVYATISNPTSNPKNIGEYYLGGITGILGGEGRIVNSTTSGSITLNKAANSSQSESYMKEIAIGGVVGYVEASSGTLYTCMNNMNITAYLDSNASSTMGYSIGGVIGAGYTRSYKDSDDVIMTSKLENLGTITVGNSSNHNYSKLYVAGIIGRHMGVSQEVSLFINSGDISVYANGNTTYVSGVENADILSSGVANTGILPSALENKQGKKYFVASSFTNGGNITVSGSQDNLNYTNVLNINASNNFVSDITSIYNLNYKRVYSSTGSSTKAKQTLGDQTITMEALNKFAPVLNVIGGSSEYTTKVTRAYNLRNININLNTAIEAATTFNYTGCILGSYITYEEIRNEGNLNITLNKDISVVSTLKVSGLFETISSGQKANNLYNGGNIKVYEANGNTNDKLINMYLAGICYENLAEDSSENQNPLNQTFDKDLDGNLSNAINKGNIDVDSYYIKKDVATNVSPSTRAHYVSNIYVGGITYMNKGIISTAFNLGNINVTPYSTSAKTYEVGGISCLMSGSYAQIRDAANNGNLYLIDLGGKVTQQNSHVNVGGIVARNTGNTNNNKEVIAFTINYGTIIGFFARDNMETTAYENEHAVASGVLGTGVCNMVNIVNYGNVYGKECVAGIMGIVKLGLFSSSNTITIANTLNYGQVKIIPPYDNAQKWATYDVIVSLETVRSNEYNLMKTHAGSICSIFDFSNQNNVTIRYLINLFNGELTVFASLNPPTSTIDVSTFITTKSATDSFGLESNKIPYAPLSTVEENGNIGVFSSNFIFRKAINGIGLDSRYVTDSYISDFFQFVKFDKVNQELLEKIGWRTIAYSSAAEDLVKNVGALEVLVRKAGTTATNLLSDAFTSDSWISNCDMDVIDSLIESSINSGELDSSITDILDYVLFNSTAVSSYTRTIKVELVEKILEYYKKQGNNNYYEILQSMLYDTLLAKVVSGDNSSYAEVKDKIVEVLSESTNLETILNTYINLLEEDSTILSQLFTGSTSSYYETAKINLVTTLLEGYDEHTLEALYSALNLTESDEDESIKYKLYLQDNPTEAANIYSHLILNNSLSTNASYLQWINNYVDKYNIGSMIDSSSLSGTADNFGNITSLTGYKYSPVTTLAQYNSTDSQVKTIRAFETADITSLNITPTKDYRNLWNIIKNDTGIQNYIANNYFQTVKNPTTDLNETGLIAKATEYTNTYQTNDRTMSDYGMVYGYDSETNGKSFYVRDINNNKYYGGVDYGYNSGGNNNYYGGNSYGDNYPIRTRFIYTPDDVVTYRTNYLGPYATKTGIVYDQKVSTSNGGTFFSGNQYGYKKGANLAATDESTQTARGTVPVFISLNEGLINNAIASSGTSASDKSLYLYHWNNHNGGNTGTDASSDYMWKHENFVTLAASNTTGYIYKNYNSGTYMYDYYNFDPTYVPTQVSDYETRVTLPNGVSTRLTNQEKEKHTYSEYYLTAYCSAAIITGLYYTYSSWPNGEVKCVSLLAKRDGTYAWNKVTSHTSWYFGVHTTDYICYKIPDLVNLDGYKTKGFSSSNPTNDQDETNIIGAICTKLLTDNKALVLKAIYNYSVDKDFTASDANTLQMLLTSITDTSFASSSVIDGITSIMNMNYSGLQTISTYLSSLNINITSYRDKIITSTVNNQVNFRSLLLVLLEEYSKKCSDYNDFNTYNRDDLNNFIYKYLTYLYGIDASITATEIDNILSLVSDTDLQNLEDLLVHIKNSVIPYDDTDYEYNDVFTIYDVTLYSNEYDSYSTTYDTNYNAVMVAGDQNYIEFETGTYQYGYQLEVTYKGTIDLDGNDSHTSNTVDTYTFTNLSYSSIFDLYCDEDTEIYNIKLLQSDYSGISSDITTCENDATSAFAEVSGTAQVLSVDFVLDAQPTVHIFDYGHYYASLWKSNNQTAAEMYIKINKGTNIEYNSINISFKTLSAFSPNSNPLNTISLYYKNNGAQASYNSYDGSLALTSNFVGQVTGKNNYNANVTLYQTNYSTTIPAQLLNTMESNDFYLTLYVDKPRTYYNNNAAFSVNDFVISYDFDFVNNEQDNTKSNVVFNQNLFNPWYSNTIYSSYTITNPNGNCGVDISGGNSTAQSLTFAADSPTTVSSTQTKQINASLLFEPWYYPIITIPGSLVSEIDLSTIDFGGDSIRQHFIDGKYNISDVAKYLVNDYFTNIQENVSFNLANESFVEIYATGEGFISILDAEDIEISSIEVNTLEDIYEYFEVVVLNGTYKITCDGTVNVDMALAIPTNVGIDYSKSGAIDTLKAVSGDDELVLLSFDYSLLSDPLNNGSSTPSSNNINTIGDENLTSFNTLFETSYDNYSLFYNVFPYKRNYNTSKTAVELRESDVFNTIITLMATIHQDNANSSYYSIFKDSTFTDENLIEVIKLVAIADNIGTNSAFKKLVEGLDSSYYKELLLTFTNEQVKINIVKKIYDIARTNNSVKNYIYAAYLGNDYLKHINLYKSTIMYSLLNVFNAPDDNPDLGIGYQFIVSDTTVDADIVTRLISYLSNSSALNIDGYGIFALSSSHGIGYGIFIPDNMDLSTLDVLYDSNLEIINLSDYDLDNPSDVEALKALMSYWRGGYVVSEGASGTVDYAFYHDMKQLILSISTDIFNLDLGNDTIKSVDDQINNVNGEIIYYVSASTFASIYNKSSITISYSSLANNAIISQDGSSSQTTISLTGENVTKVANTSITIKDAIKVYAEDRGVSKTYTIKFIAILPYGLSLDVTETSIPYTGGAVNATVTGTNLINGMDLEPFISLTVGGVVHKLTDENPKFRLDSDFANNGIVNNNSANIRIIVDPTLPGGEITFGIDIYGQSANDTFTKDKNSQAVINSAVLDGTAVTLNRNGTKTNNILFGRCYNYSELTNYNDLDNFYLYNFSYSTNANLTLTATKSTNNSTGLMTYTIVYTIVSEDGDTSATYTHKLVEGQYFTENTNYAALYADGDEVESISGWDALDEDQKPYYISNGTLNYNLNEDKYISAKNEWSLEDDMYVQVSFNRAEGREPQYRIKYNLSKFYTIGTNVVYGPSAKTSAQVEINKTTMNDTYAGLTVTVSDNNNVGRYVYVYTYKNTGLWQNDEEYERYYEFPELVIEKLASTDALIHEMTFLKESVSLGNTSTVILPNTPMIPEAPMAGGIYDGTEVLYKDAFEDKIDRKIVITSKGIQYNGEDKVENTDYYGIGTVSDADLSYYCPDFTINDYAEIYQYTTLEKLKYYGDGLQPDNATPRQSDSDATVLSNHDTMFIYVPFTNGTDSIIRLVEVDTSTGYWTNVYSTDFNGYNGTSTLIGAIPAGTRSENKGDISIAGYSVADYAGQEENNNSLFMDYIGTPLDGHFWYVSYVVFSEDYISGGPAEGSGNIRHYHISIIDATNNVQFYVKIYSPTELDLNEVYFTMSEDIYKEKDNVATYTGNKQISAFANKSVTTATSKSYSYAADTNDDGVIEENEKATVNINGYYIYELEFNLQTLPKGCFYFYLDLPTGYRVLAYTDKENKLDDNNSKYNGEYLKDVEVGSFLPFTSIITAKINLDMIIIPSTTTNQSAWAVTTTNSNNVRATYEGRS